MAIGWSVLALSGNRDVTVLDDYDEGLDEDRVSKCIGGNDAVGWKAQEGLEKRWESLFKRDEKDKAVRGPKVVEQRPRGR